MPKESSHAEITAIISASEADIMGAYIYQNEKWPDFAWSAKAISGQLAAVSRQQGRLVGRMEGMSMAFREEAVLEALTEEITQSSEIEGETLDREQIRSSLPAAGNGRSANPCAVRDR